ncbi:thioredoxin family protein [Candidatus Peregrinibacteria bacterium]|nr:thioredoxin family protein [Candidatus Peregrinibacteria bacterium]
MALTYSQTIPFGKPAPDFSLPGIDGRTYSLASFTDKKILVIIFMCNHCPYVQACWDRLIALQNKFGSRGVQLIGINSNDSGNYPEDSFEKMKEYAEKRGHNFPYLCDTSQATAKAYGAVCTPDIFIYDGSRGMAYHGRIDDNWQEPAKVKKHELAEALESLLRGEKPSQDQKPSMGCSIKWI